MSLFEKLKIKYPHIKYDELTKTYLAYESYLYEYKLFSYSAVVSFDSNQSIFLLTGNDALDFLNRVSTNNIVNLKNNSSMVTLILNEKGRFIDRIKIYRLNDSILIFPSIQNSERVFRWLTKFILTEDVQLKDISGEYSKFCIFGRKSIPFTTLLIGDENLNIEFDEVKFISQDLNVYVSKTKKFDSVLSYEFLVPFENSESFLERIIDNLNLFDCSFIGSLAQEILRVEMGYPDFPNEINLDTNPHDINLIQYVDDKKGCYIGQEVIARIETYGKIQKYLKGVIFSENIEIQTNQEIFYEDKKIGYITSSQFSPKLTKRIGLCLISKEYANLLSDKCYIVIKNQNFDVKIVNLPLVKYENIY